MHQLCVCVSIFTNNGEKKEAAMFPELSKQRPSRGRLAVRRGPMGTHHRRSRRATLPIVVQVAEKVVAVRHGGGQRHGFARPSLRRLLERLPLFRFGARGPGSGAPPPGGWFLRPLSGAAHHRVATDCGRAGTVLSVSKLKKHFPALHISKPCWTSDLGDC